MTQPIGIRLSDEILKKIDKISSEEYNNRSSILRKLILIGYSSFLKQKTAEKYLKGIITISEAANQAEITIWEMEKFLVEEGFKSDYSIEDLDEEMKILGL